MNREIIQYLEEWKNRSDRNPLILRGARQVGKTYIIEEFAKEGIEFAYPTQTVFVRK